jgi:flagellin-like hook-associated protein FlgL
MMTKLDGAIATITVGHTDIGGRLKHTSLAQDILDDMRLQAQIQRAGLQDVDLAAAITNMTTAEQAMVAVIEASKRLMGASALRWLR